MAYGILPALTIQSGITKQIRSGQGYLGVGDGIDTNTAEALQIGVANASSVVLGGSASYGVVISGSQTFTTGTGNVLVNGNVLAVNGKNPDFDFSCSDGYFYTSTGANNLNGNVTVTGTNTVTISAFNTAGVVHNTYSGLLTSSLIVNSDISASAAISVNKLAAGSSAQILQTVGSTSTWVTVSGDASIAPGGSVTINNLQGNPINFVALTSAQDGYIATWTGTAIEFLQSAQPTITDFQGGTPATLGTACYISANDTAAPTDNTMVNKSYCAGFVSSNGNLIVDGVVTPIINGSAPAGSLMYLDGGANAGKVTATPPSQTGSSIAPVGFMKNSSQMVIRVLLPEVL